MFKSSFIITVFIILALCNSAFATGASIDRAWAGCTYANPCTLSPQTLASYGDFVTNDYPTYYLNKMSSSNDVWYNWDDNQTPERDYNYILYQFEDKDYTSAVCRWEVRVDGGSAVTIFFWDGSNWDNIASNSGGSDPGVERTNVDLGYFDGEFLTVLVVGPTPGPGEDRISCDVCQLAVEP